MNNNKIYCYTNTHNNKKYIGQTSSSIKLRADNGKGYEDCPKFWKAIQKYGWDSFTVEILEENLDFEAANRQETFYIKKFNTIENGYNCTTGGKSDYTFSKEVKERISKKSKETYNFEAHEKEVYKFSLDGTFLEKYKSAASAARLNSGNKAHITACCKNKRNSHCGFLWSYSAKIDASSKKSSKVRTIYQFSITGIFIKQWNNMNEILEANPTYERDRITDCCNFYSPSAYGAIWSYSKEIKIRNDNRTSKNRRISIKHNEIVYKSFYEASRKEGISPNKIRKMIIENRDNWSYNETN